MVRPGHIPRLSLEDPRAWAALLEPGEELLWQARPALPRLVLMAQNRWALIGLLALPVVVTMGILAFLPDASAQRVVGVGCGLALALVAWWLGGAVRAHFTTLYTITTRRAIISRAPLGRSGWVDSDSWDITPDMPLSLTHGPDGAMVQFAIDEVPSDGGTRQVAVGFERLEDGPGVLALLRSVQTEVTP